MSCMTWPRMVRALLTYQVVKYQGVTCYNLTSRPCLLSSEDLNRLPTLVLSTVVSICINKEEQTPACFTLPLLEPLRLRFAPYTVACVSSCVGAAGRWWW